MLTSCAYNTSNPVKKGLIKRVCLEVDVATYLLSNTTSEDIDRFKQ